MLRSLADARQRTLRSLAVSRSERLWAARIVPPDLAKLEELVLGHAQRLIYLRDDFDELVVKRAVGVLGDFRQEVVGDRIAVLVERDLAGRRFQNQARQGRPQLAAAIRHIGIDLLEAGQQRRRVDVVPLGNNDGDGKAFGSFL